MENQYEHSQNVNLEETNDIEEQQLISVSKFIILSLLSFGVYDVWWMYKAWRFFQHKDKLNILPALRALLTLFFAFSLFNKISDFSKEKKYHKSYYPGLLTIGYIAITLLAWLPDPLSFISLVKLIFLIPPFKALNFAKRNSNDFTVIEQTSFNTRQIVLIIFGTIFWGLIIMGLLLGDV